MLKCLKEKTIQTIFKSGMFLKTECCCYCCCCYCYVTNHVISPACLTCQMLEPLPRVQGYLREYQKLLLLQSGSTLNTGQSYSYYYHSIASHFVSWSNIYLVFLFPFLAPSRRGPSYVRSQTTSDSTNSVLAKFYPIFCSSSAKLVTLKKTITKTQMA